MERGFGESLYRVVPMRTCQTKIPSVVKPQFFRICTPVETVQTAGDAGYSLLDYVQISLSVTKVLIRKRF